MLDVLPVFVTGSASLDVVAKLMSTREPLTIRTIDGMNVDPSVLTAALDQNAGDTVVERRGENLYAKSLRDCKRVHGWRGAD